MSTLNPSDAPFEVVEAQEFLGLAANMLGSVQRWDEIKWSQDWRLERDPRGGNYLPHYDLWVLRFRTEPPLWVYYLLDDAAHRVTLVDIQVFPL